MSSVGTSYQSAQELGIYTNQLKSYAKTPLGGTRLYTTAIMGSWHETKSVGVSRVEEST